MIQRYDFAPLDGITKVVFRQVYHRMFGGADRYFIPFFSPTDQHILTKRDQRELDPAANAGLPVVPQVMTRRAPDFLWAAEIVADMGYTEVNLNLGCPSGTVTAKGKGAGFLAKPEELRGWWEKSGMPLKKFFNTSGLQYKALGLKDKLPEMSEEEQLALLATDGMLVKRPILVGEDFVRTGFRQAEWETALG